MKTRLDIKRLLLFDSYASNLLNRMMRYLISSNMLFMAVVFTLVVFSAPRCLKMLTRPPRCFKVIPRCLQDASRHPKMLPRSPKIIENAPKRLTFFIFIDVLMVFDTFSVY